MDRLEIIERMNKILAEVVELSEAIDCDVRFHIWTEDGERKSLADISLADTLYSLSNFVKPHALIWRPGNPEDYTWYDLQEVPYKVPLAEAIKKEEP